MGVARRWSRKHERCVRCGTDLVPHLSRGLCRNCYWADSARRESVLVRRPRGEPTRDLDPETLRREYVDEGLSVRMIGARHGCTGGYVYVLMKRARIPCRSHPAASRIAHEEGRILVPRDGAERYARVSRHVLKEDFFDRWSPEMAWVLGIVTTDGCLIPNLRIDPRGGRNRRYQSGFSICQKEPELLDKVRALLGTNQAITFRPRRGVAGAVHNITFTSERLYSALCRLGLSPRKSRTIRFPDVPYEVLRHYLRGCWDGDGSIYYERGDPRFVRADYVSGSEEFMRGLVGRLESMGIRVRRIHRKLGTNTWYIKLARRSCLQLGNEFYRGVPERICLGRKREKYLQAAIACCVPECLSK